MEQGVHGNYGEEGGVGKVWRSLHMCETSYLCTQYVAGSNCTSFGCAWVSTSNLKLAAVSLLSFTP